MATITPTRLGLKYGPVPTLALEYEEDLGVVENDDGTRSLYVFKETPSDVKRVRKKLHVVELPQLHGRSEPLAVVRQLQKDNYKFLGPSIVKEQQLQRLLQQLVDHLPSSRGVAAADDVAPKPGGGVDGRDDVRVSERAEPVMKSHATDAKDAEDKGDEEGEDEPLEQSGMEESVAEASMSHDVSRAEDDDRHHAVDGLSTHTTSRLDSRHRTGKFLTQEDSDGGDDAAGGHHSDDEDDHASSPQQRRTTNVKQPPTENDRAEIDEDEKKKKALKSESEGSEEEDVQSEELEYFSEDGSDEDSF